MTRKSEFELSRLEFVAPGCKIGRVPNKLGLIFIPIREKMWLNNLETMLYGFNYDENKKI